MKQNNMTVGTEMAEPATTVRFFELRSQAINFVLGQNISRRVDYLSRKSRHCKCLVIIHGPEDNFAAVEIDEAKEMEMPYYYVTGTYGNPQIQLFA